MNERISNLEQAVIDLGNREKNIEVWIAGVDVRFDALDNKVDTLVTKVDEIAEVHRMHSAVVLGHLYGLGHAIEVLVKESGFGTQIGIPDPIELPNVSEDLMDAINTTYRQTVKRFQVIP